jgi:hypothetical protein
MPRTAKLNPRHPERTKIIAWRLYPVKKWAAPQRRAGTLAWLR